MTDIEASAFGNTGVTLAAFDSHGVSCNSRPAGATSDLDPNNACSIKAGETASITAPVYSVPQYQVATNPNFSINTEAAIATCAASGTCEYFDFDFADDRQISSGQASYFVSNEQMGTNAALFEKNTLEYSIGAVQLTYKGSGYTTAPTVTFDLPDGSQTATCTATLNATGGVSGVTFTPGSGFAYPPSVVITDAKGGTGATFSVTVSPSGVITGISVTNAGSGYTSAPTLAIYNRATAHTTIDAVTKQVTSIVLDNPGGSYTVAPNVVISSPTGPATGQVATATASITEKPILVQPPGFQYNMFPVKGTYIGAPTQKSVDSCAKACDDTANCKGFNFRSLSSSCALLSTIDGTDFDDQVSSNVAFISEKRVDPDTPDEQVGLIKTTGVTQVGLPGTDFTNSGAYCSDLPQCNTDIAKLLTDGSGVSALSTGDIESCQYCPLKGFDKATLTVTDEIGVTHKVATKEAAIPLLQYTRNLADEKQVQSGVYNISKWMSAPTIVVIRNGIYDRADILPNQTIYVSPTGYILNNFGGKLGNGIYFEKGDTSTYKDHTTYHKWNMHTEYTYTPSTYNENTDPLTFEPVDYVTNGFTPKSSKGYLKYVSSTGGTYISRDVPTDEDAPETEKATHREKTVSCTNGGNSFAGCPAIKYATPPKYSSAYNDCIWTAVPSTTTTIRQFLTLLASGKKYCHNTITDTYYAFGYSTKGLIQDFLTLQNPAVYAADGQYSSLECVVNYDDRNFILESGDILYLDGRKLEVTSSQPGTNRTIVLRAADTTLAGQTVPSGKRLYQDIIKRRFSTDHNNLMLAWYKDVDPSWTDLGVDISAVFDEGRPMEDPYKETGLFRTLPDTPVSEPAGINWLNNPANQKGCDTHCDQNLLYKCYNSANYSCDTDSNDLAMRGPACAGTFRVCVPDIATQQTTLAKQFTGLTPVDNVITSTLKGNPLQSGLSTGLYSHPNYSNPHSVTMSTTYMKSGSVSIDSSEITYFPTWMRTRLNSSGTTTQATLARNESCDPGYGYIHIIHISLCEICPAGTYSPGGYRVSCSPCSSGNYCPQGSPNNTTQCEAGYFCSTPASKQTCPLGSYCPVGSPTPILCASAVVGTTVSTTTNGQTGAGSWAVGEPPFPLTLTDQTQLLTNYVVYIANFASLLQTKTVGAPSTFELFNPGSWGVIPDLTPALIQTRALMCPAGSSSVQRCSLGYRCPDPTQKKFCQAGHYCNIEGYGVYTGIPCPANEYYTPPGANILVGQANSDGSQCYKCPLLTPGGPASGPRYAVNSDQSGCECPGILKWSTELALCYFPNCPAGKQPNATNDGCDDCPDGYFSENPDSARCLPCPKNFTSEGINAAGVVVHSAAVSCRCTTTRNDGTTLATGTLSFNSLLKRCQVTCPSETHFAFFSDCLPKQVVALQKPSQCAGTLTNYTIHSFGADTTTAGLVNYRFVTYEYDNGTWAPFTRLQYEGGLSISRNLVANDSRYILINESASGSLCCSTGTTFYMGACYACPGGGTFGFDTTDGTCHVSKTIETISCVRVDSPSVAACSVM
jgi:hypothetical protein